MTLWWNALFFSFLFLKPHASELVMAELEKIFRGASLAGHLFKPLFTEFSLKKQNWSSISATHTITPFVRQSRIETISAINSQAVVIEESATKRMQWNNRSALGDADRISCGETRPSRKFNETQCVTETDKSHRKVDFRVPHFFFQLCDGSDWCTVQCRHENWLFNFFFYRCERVRENVWKPERQGYYSIIVFKYRSFIKVRLFCLDLTK